MPNLPSVQALIDAMPWQAAIVGVEGTIRVVNRSWLGFAEANGGTGDDVGQNYLAVCDAVSATEPDAAEAAHALRAVLSGQGASRTVEYPCHSPTAPHWFVMTASAIVEDGAVTGALITHTEITARRESEQDLRAFVAHAAHDLRSPLRHLASFTELLEMDLADKLGSQHQGWLAAIRQAALHMQSQLDNLLALARSRLEPLRFIPVDLRRLVPERLRIQHEMLRASAELDVSGLGEVVTDRKLVTVLVDNVLTNALRHGADSDAPMIQVASATDDHGTTVLFDDNGPGFGGVDTELLLRPYQRGPTSRDRAGLGLGLSIVKQVAQRLGGDLRLAVSPLGGARVAIHLPSRSPGAEQEPVKPDAIEIRRFG